MSGDEEPEEKPANVVRVDFKRAQRTSPSDPLAPQKFAVFSRFIAKGKTMVTLDARRPGVSVPRHLAEEPQLNLDFSERFGLADFVYDERGVRASLSFKGQPFFCDVPWASVYALFSHVANERLTWARALPQEILEQLPEASIEHLELVLERQLEKLMRDAREQSAGPAVVRAAPPPPALLDEAPPPPNGPVVPGEASDDEPRPTGPAGGGGLRLVK